MIQIVSQAVPTHIITGFLGAGKTTLLKQWLSTKPKDEVWAVLMNEFGQIGLDQLWVEEQGIAVKEVLGGCLCCTSQLPMQITLGRLLSHYKPDRLFIEPTGLGHPKDLLKQLTQTHWKSSLKMKHLVTVIDGARLHEKLWEQHEIFTQQIDAAQQIIISHADEMQPQDHQQLDDLKKSYVFLEKKWHFANHGEMDFQALDQAYDAPEMKKKILLTQAITTVSDDHQNQNIEPKTLPYHYHSQQNEYQVGGWHLPKSWIFDADQLLNLLQGLTGWERIKAKLRTDQGWIDINAITTGFSVDFAAKAALDQRLEIITQNAQDWLLLEQKLLATKQG